MKKLLKKELVQGKKLKIYKKFSSLFKSYKFTLRILNSSFETLMF